MVASNLVALGLLICYLVTARSSDGGSLLLDAVQVWVTNVIAFGLIYCELDRGGPVARTQTALDRLPLADFRFTQDNVIEVTAGVQREWMRTLVDYLYLSTRNSSAFSPTDTMPLISRAKILIDVCLRPHFSLP